MAQLPDNLESFELMASRLKRERELLLEQRARWLDAASIQDHADPERPGPFLTEAPLSDWGGAA